MLKTTRDKRSRILKAAVKVFADKGFYNTRVAEIAKKAGVADGTIYLYFKSKDEILIHIFEEEMQHFIEEIRQAVDSETETIARLRTFVKTHLAFVKRNPKLAHVFQLELRQSHKFIKEYTGSKVREYLDIIGELVEAGQRDGTLRPDVHPSLVKRALFGALDEISTHWVLSKNGKYDLAATAEQIGDIFVRGLIVQNGK